MTIQHYTTLYNHIYTTCLDMYSSAWGRIQEGQKRFHKCRRLSTGQMGATFFQATLHASASLVGGSNLASSKRFGGRTAAPPSLCPQSNRTLLFALLFHPVARHTNRSVEHHGDQASSNHRNASSAVVPALLHMPWPL